MLIVTPGALGFFRSMYSNLFNLHFFCTCSLKSHYIRGLLEVAYKNEIKEFSQFLSYYTSCLAQIACLGCVLILYGFCENTPGSSCSSAHKALLKVRREEHGVYINCQWNIKIKLPMEKMVSVDIQHIVMKQNN